MTKRTEEWAGRLIALTLLLGVLVTLALFFLFVSGGIYLLVLAFGKWGW